MSIFASFLQEYLNGKQIDLLSSLYTYVKLGLMDTMHAGKTFEQPSSEFSSTCYCLPRGF